MGDDQIQGLPNGAVVKPIQGLPPGAITKPISDPLKTGEGMVAPPRQQPVPPEMKRDITMSNQVDEFEKERKAPSPLESIVGDVKGGNYARAGHKAFTTAAGAYSPLLVPALAAAPLATGLGLAGSTVGNYGTHRAAEYMGASPDQADLAGDIGAIAGGAAGGGMGELVKGGARSYLRGPSKSEPVSINPYTAVTRQLEARVPMDEPVGAKGEMAADIQKEQLERMKAKSQMDTQIEKEKIKRAGAHAEMEADRAKAEKQQEANLKVAEDARQKELADAERLREQHAAALNARGEYKAPVAKGQPGYIPTQDETLIVPEPLPLRPGAKIGDLFSVPREQLVPGAEARNPSASETLQRLGQPMLYTPKEGVGYPGPRQEYAPAEPAQQGGNPPYFSTPEYPPAETNQPRFGSRSREELAGKTSSPEDQVQALRTENQRLESELRTKKGTPAERRQAEERLEQNNQMIKEMEKFKF